MTMKKRLPALLLALVMLLALCACTAEKPSEDDGSGPVAQPPADQSQDSGDAGAALPEGVVADLMGNTLTLQQFQYWYWDAYYDFLNAYGTNYFDPETPMGEQMMSENATWEDYFIDRGLNQWLTIQLLTAEAKKQDFKMPAETQAELDTLEADVTKYAKDTLGISDVNAYFEEYYGKGANMADFKAYSELLYYATAFGDVKYAEVLEQVVNGAKDPTRMVDVRHILLSPADMNSDADWADAKKKAQEIYDEWKKDPTEKNFAALATAKTEDPGSASTGGLYEDVYPGQMVETFNDWCFDKERKVGDHGIVETNYGYHIMYFSGFGEVYTGELEQQAVEQYYDWIGSLVTPESLEADLDRITVNLNGAQSGKQ